MILSVISGVWAQKKKFRIRMWRWMTVISGTALLAVAAWAGSLDPESRSERTAVVLGATRLLSADEMAEAIRDRSPMMVALIESLEKAVTTGHPEKVRPYFDGHALMSLAMAGTPEDPALEGIRAAYVNGTLEAWTVGGPLEGLGDGHYQFLRVRTINGHSGLLFRLAHEEELNYHLHQLTVDAVGRYKVADTYLVGLSESISDATRRGFLHLAADSLPGADEPTAEVEHSRLFVENMASIGALNAAVVQGRYSEALDLYHALPPQLQRDRDVLLMRVEAAGAVSPLLLDEALTDWKEISPLEAALPLKFMDYHVARGEYESAHALAKRVENLTGGDSYLLARIGELQFAIADQAPVFRSEIRRRAADRPRAGRDEEIAQ